MNQITDGGCHKKELLKKPPIPISPSIPLSIHQIFGIELASSPSRLIINRFLWPSVYNMVGQQKMTYFWKGRRQLGGEMDGGIKVGGTIDVVAANLLLTTGCPPHFLINKIWNAKSIAHINRKYFDFAS